VSPRKVVMHRVREIVEKQREVFSVRHDWTVLDVARYMSERNIGAVAVLDDKGRVVGMFSERDLMTRVVAVGQDPRRVRVAEVMSRNVQTARLDDTLEECMQKMREHRCRHLPVVENDRLLGMISMRDIIEFQLMDREQQIEFMRAYIAQVPPGFGFSP